MSRLDRLAVHPQRFGRRRGTGLDAHLFAERGVNFLPNSGQTPVAEQAVDRLPRREIVGDHPPRPTGPQVVEDGIDHLSPIDGNRLSAFASAGFRLGQQWVQTFPLLVGQIGRVRFPTHGRHEYSN